MGRPIKKSFFGSDANSLELSCNTGSVANRTIVAQKGTGKYQVNAPSNNIVKLVNKTTGLLLGEASLVHDGKIVRKINQYVIFYFDGTTGAWRDSAGNLVGVFGPVVVPPPVV